jgi:Arc/MetJ-type ribon-helix-helix transcriptional regulator
MATTISFVAEPAFSKRIDELVARTGLYQSKSEYVRAAVREKLEKDLSFEESLIAVRKMRENLQKNEIQGLSFAGRKRQACWTIS